MQKKKPDSKVPVYSHNPYDNNPFPLLVLDVHRKVCTPANEGFRVLHWHEEIQFVHVLKGSIHIKIYENTLDVPAGDCLFLNRSVLHCITEKENCHYHSILIPERMLGFFPGSIMAQQDVASVLHNPAFTHKFLQKKNPAQEEFFHMLDSFEQLYFDTDALSHREYRLSLAVTSLWLSFLTLLPTLLPAVPVKDYERIRAMLSHIHTHYAKPIAVEDLAACAHIGKSECQRSFRRFTGLSPYRYLIQYRLHAAAVLLKTTDRSVTEIALQTGFASASSCIGYFRQKYGMTPREYRKHEED